MQPANKKINRIVLSEIMLKGLIDSAGMIMFADN